MPEPVADLDSLKSALASSSSVSRPKPFDSDASQDGKAGDKAELIKLREQFEGLVIRSQAKITDERVFSSVRPLAICPPRPGHLLTAVPCHPCPPALG